jgi:polysaccharide export outer membrane protein
MKMSLKLVFALVFAAALCCAQNEAAAAPVPPSGAPAGPAAASNQDPAANAAINQVAPPAAPVAVPPPATNLNDQLPPVRKSGVEAKASSVATGNPAALATGAKPAGGKAYVIGPLDVLMIKVWNNPNLSGPVDVGPDGMISMPLVGEIKADGLTREQLRDSIATHLGDFLNSPEVDVQVVKVNSKRYFVYGGVLKQGEFPLVEDTTIMDALSNTGGFKDFANQKKIYVLRGAQRFDFNYKDASKGKNLDKNILLQNGDRIFVPE